MEKEFQKVKSSDCVVLTLVLKKKWFDMIREGNKRREYRSAKSICRQIERWYGYAKINEKVPVVKFCLGYGTRRETMTFMATSVWKSTRSTCPEWGEPEGFHYVISLARQIDLV